MTSKNHHYYTSTIYDWATHADLQSAAKWLKVRRRESKKHELYKQHPLGVHLLLRVPLPLDASYKIEGYSPVLPSDKKCTLLSFNGMPYRRANWLLPAPAIFCADEPQLTEALS